MTKPTGLTLTPLQIDALQEIANIGGSNAATCLSQLVNAPIEIISPSMSLVQVQDFIDSLTPKASQKVVVAKMDVMGATPGNILLFLNYKDASHLVDLLLGRKKQDKLEMDLVEHQTLKQVSVILSASYLYALSKFLQMTIVPGDPILRSITLGEAVEYLLAPLSQIARSGFLIKNEFLEAYSKVEGNLLFLPYQQALETMLVVINEKAGKWRKFF